MRLSMWIFADWFRKYNPEVHIREGNLEIETVRLFSADTEVEENCVYVGRISDLFMQGSDNVICTHRNDIIILPTDEMDEVMNAILNAFEYYQDWNVRMLEAISANSRPSDILAIAQEIIREPMYLLDSNQYAIAMSDGYPRGSVNEFWDQMLENGSADVTFLNKLNQVYPQHMSIRGLYCFQLPFLPNRSYNYNMFLEKNWIGLSSILELHGQLPQHTIDLFHIFCRNMELWFISHSQEQRSLMIDSQFREVLMSEGAVSENFVRQCRIHFQHLSREQYIMVLMAPPEHALLTGHMSKELNLTFPEILAIIYQNHICVLLNPKEGEKDRLIQEMLPLLRRNGFYGGLSSAFEHPEQIHRCYEEAVYAAQQMEAEPGQIRSFQDYALHWILQQMKDSPGINPVHPAVIRLLEYDKKHRTEFARTLHVYLKKERSQSRTAAALNLHRNSLTYRLQRLKELLDCDLEVDDVRLHVLLSFEIMQNESQCKLFS